MGATRTKADYESKNLNYKLFDEINSEESAYFLGLMCADGNNFVSKRDDYQIAIALQTMDLHILETFKQNLCPNQIIKFKKRRKPHHHDQFKLKIDSKIISRQLTKLGCIPAKSLKLKMPKIPEYLFHHFVRGYFDGDGSIYFNAKQRKSHIYDAYTWKITSSFDFCKSVKIKLDYIHGIKLYLKKSNNGITTSITINGNHQVIKLMEWMYRGANIYLYRKYNRFLHLKRMYALQTIIPRLRS